jgi:pimeloyl-ACP methyl ester carboxylesterase
MKPSILRRTLALLAALWLSALPAHSIEARHGPGGHDKTVVLVHGAFADGSCWSEVIRLLQGHGVKVVSVQNPLASLSGDVSATHRVVDQQTTPVVLVAHSWGGVVITEAGMNPKVTSLVYVAAFAPDVGDSVFGLLQAFPRPPWLAGIVQDSGGYQTLGEETFLNYFAPGLPLRQARTLFAVQGPTFGGTLTDRTSMAAWRSKPSTYVVAEDDQIIPPELQRAMASRIRARTTSVAAGHLVILTHPAKVAQAILAAVRDE